MGQNGKDCIFWYYVKEVFTNGEKRGTENSQDKFKTFWSLGNENQVF